ncbi:MAG: hypothetical protein ACRD4K_04140 [Candidatus Acidiferrales bacterium]
MEPPLKSPKIIFFMSIQRHLLTIYRWMACSPSPASYFGKAYERLAFTNRITQIARNKKTCYLWIFEVWLSWQGSDIAAGTKRQAQTLSKSPARPVLTSEPAKLTTTAVSNPFSYADAWSDLEVDIARSGSLN